MTNLCVWFLGCEDGCVERMSEGGCKCFESECVIVCVGGVNVGVCY